MPATSAFSVGAVCSSGEGRLFGLWVPHDLSGALAGAGQRPGVHYEIQQKGFGKDAAECALNCSTPCCVAQMTTRNFDVSAIRYPAVRVQLTGRDGNALAIVGAVSRALHEARVPRQDVEAFQAEALSGNYERVIRVVLSWVTVL